MQPKQEIENINDSTFKYIFRHFSLLILILIVSDITVIILFPQIFPFALFVLFIILGVSYSFAFKKIQKEFLKQFGLSIGFSYTDSADMDSVQGKLFGIGQARSIYGVLSGNYNDIPVRIFNYQFTIAEGRSSTTIFFTIFEAVFLSSMPDMTVSSQSQIQFVDDVLDDGETLNLEGDFSKYFLVRAPKGSEIEAYQILTPDVMANLIDKARNLNFEFNKNKLYIYVPKIISTKNEMQSMFTLVEYLDGMLKHNVSEVHV